MPGRITTIKRISFDENIAKRVTMEYKDKVGGHLMKVRNVMYL